MDTIGRQVTTFVTLFMAAALIVLMYLIFEPQRRGAALDYQRRTSIERGARLYVANCVVCHGANGQGVAGAGFPLNIDKNRSPSEARQKELLTVIERGRLNSTGKLPNMPAWSERENGPFNDQMINDVITFISYGDFAEVPKILVAQGTPVSALPTPPGRGTPNGAAASGGPPPVVSDDPGAAVFEKSGCNSCHKIAPEFPSGGTIGPNLTGVASKPQIPTTQPTLPVTEEGLTQWIRTAPEVKPGTQMPAFGEDAINQQEMQDLVKWLLKHK